MGTPLYYATLKWADEHLSDGARAYVRGTWYAVPWMIGVRTGTEDAGMHAEVRRRCTEVWGPMHNPSLRFTGQWYLAPSSIYGVSYAGLQSEKHMRKFIEIAGEFDMETVVPK